MEEGELNSKFFLGLEKSRQKGNTISYLSGDKDVTNDEDILNAAATFYDELYKSKCISDNIIEEYLNNVDITSTLSEEESNTLEGKIKYKECEIVVKKWALNKSPGLDGISNEFYKKFWSDIGKLIVDSFNESYEKKELTESQRTAVIALLYKKGDAQLLKNYRPISLTNCDYKILAFCLANRLQNVIKSIIHPGQVSYIKGRFIGCNIRLIEDVIHYYDMYNEEGLLLMLDFQKAFDSLEWNFIYKALKMFNIGDSFIKWIQTLYSEPVACVKNNGYLSRTFKLGHGVR